MYQGQIKHHLLVQLLEPAVQLQQLYHLVTAQMLPWANHGYVITGNRIVRQICISQPIVLEDMMELPLTHESRSLPGASPMSITSLLMKVLSVKTPNIHPNRKQNSSRRYFFGDKGTTRHTTKRTKRLNRRSVLIQKACILLLLSPLPPLGRAVAMSLCIYEGFSHHPGFCFQVCTIFLS